MPAMRNRRNCIGQYARLFGVWGTEMSVSQYLASQHASRSPTVGATGSGATVLMLCWSQPRLFRHPNAAVVMMPIKRLAEKTQ